MLQPGSSPRSQLLHPLTKQPIRQISFDVVGHDHMVFSEPPALKGLPAQNFYDYEEVDAIIDQIRIRLERRAAAVSQIAGRLGSLGIPSIVENESMLVLADVELDGFGVVVLQGNENGLLAQKLIGSDQQITPLNDSIIDLNQVGQKNDLDMLLTSIIYQAKTEEGLETLEPIADEVEEEQEAASNIVTLSRLTGIMGEDTICAPGLILYKELNVAGKTVHFSARYQKGQIFYGKISSDDGTNWDGEFDLATFPGIEDFVAGQMGTAQVESTKPTEATAPLEPAAPKTIESTYQLPFVGEIWVMKILIEEETPDEIRYVGVSVDGKPFGAPRVLSRADFMNVFNEVSKGVYQLQVEIVSVEDDLITYARLGPDHQWVGKPGTSKFAPFLANFIPETVFY
jgi:hypothetical protein